MTRTGSVEHGSTESLRTERTGSVLRYPVPAEDAVAGTGGPSPRGAAADEYVIELDVAAGFLWWWSLFPVVELDGEGTDVMAARSVAPVAAARLPLLSRRYALRAGKREARRLSETAGAAVSPTRRAVPRLSRRAVRLGLIVLAAGVVAGTLLALNSSRAPTPRTEVLRSASPLSDIWVRITGPGGAVSYVGQRFMTSGAFSKFTFRKEPARGLFLPPPVREQKLCASTHVIQPGDAPQLQRWQGRTLAITIYGKKASSIYCAVLGYGLYLG